MNQRNEIESEFKPVRSGQEIDSGNFYTGSETFFGVFTQAQVYMSGVRLVHADKVTQQVSDLASQIENNRRRFLHSGDVNFALQELTRITNSFNQRVQAWESEATRRERNKKTMSGGALAKMKAELTMVRTKTRLASRTLTKLEVELHQISGRESSESKSQPLDAGEDRAEVTGKDIPVEEQEPVLSIHEQARAVAFADELSLFLRKSIGASLPISFDNAKLNVVGKPDRMEQVWDAKAEKTVPVFLASGWAVKHPGNPDGMNRARKKLDFCFWLIPKSLGASKAMKLVDGQVELWISSRKLDSARITFRIADQNEFPESELMGGFLHRFSEKYGTTPNLLVAHFHNLEWTQKTIIASCSEIRE